MAHQTWGRRTQSPGDLGSARLTPPIETIYRHESRRVLATLIRLLGDFDLAEEALHEAFLVAMQRWEHDGVPSNPRA